jgi:hypothetical protein
MQNQFGQAGRSARETGKKKRSDALWIGIGAIAVVVVLGFVLINNKVFGLGGGAILVILILMKIMPDLIKKPIDRRLKEEKKYNQGAKGEEDIGQLLAQLGPDYVVMHDWESPYGNIDHIVYDKAGNIFMIETKSHYGKVEAQGDNLLRDGRPFEKDIIHQSLSNSFWMKNKIEQKLGLKAWVTPVLVFTNAFVVFGQPIKSVYYMNKKYLVKFIQEHKDSSPAGLKLWEMRRY